MQCSPLEGVSDGDLAEAAHYSKFAFAAYGYMLYIWSKPQYKCAFFPSVFASGSIMKSAK